MINMGPWRCAAAEAAVILAAGPPGGIHTAAPAPRRLGVGPTQAHPSGVLSNVD